MPSFDIQQDKKIHLVGIGGCGMSGLGKILTEMGFKISGSDVKEGPNTLRLRDLGIKIFIGHEASQIRDADIIVVTSAASRDNPELQEAEAKGLKIMKRAEMLAWVMDQSKNRIAVAGTHGKTTTTAMLAKVLDAAKKEPTFLIGCDMDYVEGNARLGNGSFAVAEADESDSSFLLLSPTAEIITNIEPDHMEHFGSIDKLLSTFEQFASKVSGSGLITIDATDPNNKQLMKKIDTRYITYGLDPSMEFSAKDIKFDNYNSSYTVVRGSSEMGRAELSIPGRQNVLNSLAVFAVGTHFGIEFSSIAGALRTFVGARRRFSKVGEMNGITIIDDYAHHPTEVKATLAAARSGWPGRRIICVFQPHRFTRTALLKDSFAQAFDQADKVIISEIYAASEEPIPGVSGKTIADLIDPKKVSYMPKKEQIADHLVQDVKEGDMVLTLGAGDIYTVGKELLARLKMGIA